MPITPYIAMCHSNLLEKTKVSNKFPHGYGYVMVLGQTKSRTHSFLRLLSHYQMIFPSSNQSVGFFEGASFYHIRRLMDKSDFEELFFVLPVVDSILVSCEVSDVRWQEKAIQYGLTAHIASQSAHVKGLYIEVNSQQEASQVNQWLRDSPEVYEIYDKIVVGKIKDHDGMQEFIGLLRFSMERVAMMALHCDGCFCK